LHCPCLSTVRQAVQGDRSTFAVPGANGLSSPRPQRYCFSDRPFLTAWAAGLTGAARRSQGPFHSLAAVWGCSERPTMLSAGASAAVRSVAGLRRRSDVRDARTLQPNIYTACSRLSCWQKGGSVGGHVRSCLVLSTLMPLTVARCGTLVAMFAECGCCT
jgi:hypothetical protein